MDDDPRPVPTKEDVAQFMAEHLETLLSWEAWPVRYEWDGKKWRVILPGDPEYAEARYEFITIDSQGKRIDRKRKV